MVLTAKKIIKFLKISMLYGVIMLVMLSTIISCADELTPVEDPVYIPIHVISITDPQIILNIKTPEQYQKECIREEWFFCDLNAHWRMKITKDICFDPPKILDVGECEEFLECDPTNYNMGEVGCITWDGFPGTQEQICDKGKIKFLDCTSLCFEEVCDGEDNDCDEFIDEGQLNACGLCGFVPPDVCDGVDNDCDGAIDEDLIQECSTACGVGLEYCIGGDWVSCTAPPVQIEICDGFDNDCDGSIDEELKCECTLAHVGALFPCNESPLLCGKGYKTCECADPECVKIYTTECVAPCVYFPEPGVPCDPTIGMSLVVEECNNFDDNCNELIDEDLYAQCYSEDPNTLYIGICEPGQLMCFEGTWGNYLDDMPDNFIPGMCKDEVTPQEEICNGIDDDCDGITDAGEEMDPVDILFIVDWSGSMDTEIYAVMASLNKFAGNYSDEEVLQWGILIGPIDSQYNVWKEHLKLHHNLSGFSDFMAAIAQLNLNSYTMSGAREMMYDAIYLAMHNLVGAGSLPVLIADLTWDVVKGVTESDPPKENFIINWRTDTEVERVIILFTDEVPQSYFLPKITQDNLLELISKTFNTRIYVFTKEWYKNNGTLVDGWEPICSASDGKYYELSSDMLVVYNSLMEIIDENACK
jgi:hypothetical protein